MISPTRSVSALARKLSLSTIFIVLLVSCAGGGSPVADLAQQSSTTSGGGDGTVPMSSASFQGGWSAATIDGGPLTDGQLPNDTGVLNQVLAWIS